MGVVLGILALTVFLFVSEIVRIDLAALLGELLGQAELRDLIDRDVLAELEEVGCLDAVGLSHGRRREEQQPYNEGDEKSAVAHGRRA